MVGERLPLAGMLQVEAVAVGAQRSHDPCLLRYLQAGAEAVAAPVLSGLGSFAAAVVAAESAFAAAAEKQSEERLEVQRSA